MADYKKDQDRFFAELEEKQTERDRAELTRTLAAFHSEKAVRTLREAAIAWALENGKTPLEAEAFADLALREAIAANWSKVDGPRH